jgi:heme A synthase
VPPGTAEAKALNAKADAKFQQALVYNTYGDRYSLLTVLFALVLFLTAISQRELRPWMQYTFLALALVAGLAAVILMLTFPIDV